MSLRWETLPPELAPVLRKLMRLEALQAFFLAGGTALALRLGHRVSVDIDLFTGQSFDAAGLGEELGESAGLEQVQVFRNTVRGFIGDIKVECLRHAYPMLRPVEQVEGLRLASLEDLGAFKANALSNRGAKKDFWDYHALLALFGWEGMLQLCGKKYEGSSLWNLEKSLLYFDDAEREPDPVDLRGVNWEQVKKDLRIAAGGAFGGQE